MMNKDDFDATEQWRRPTGGIFISKGMTLGIPADGLTIQVDERGDIKTEINLHVHYDVCPSWLELAFKHLLEAEARSMEVSLAWQTPDDNRLARALEAEFESGMQAMMSGAIAIDAFYASVKDKITLPEELTRSWSKNKTARHKQIAEVMRRGFLMGEKTFHQVRDNLKEIMRLRDMAVHPSGKIDEPILHPELNLGMEWRFVTFRYLNAKLVVGACLSLIAQLAIHPRDEFESLKNYCNSLQYRISPIVGYWEEKFGELYRRTDENNFPTDGAEET
jgi:hypothetical protein